MARVKRGVPAHAKHKKVLKKAKGYYGRRKNTIRIAKQAVEKAMQYAYRDRKRRQRRGGLQSPRRPGRRPRCHPSWPSEDGGLGRLGVSGGSMDCEASHAS